jgi:hypothetical protein
MTGLRIGIIIGAHHAADTAWIERASAWDFRLLAGGLCRDKVDKAKKSFIARIPYAIRE